MAGSNRVLVIGSGFGGAISASRIAEAGFTVTVMERGPWRDSVPVRSMGIADRAPFPIGRHFFSGLLRSVRNPSLPGGRVTLNMRGFLELYVGKRLTILSASNVGGGSHVYGALNMRPPEPGYWNAAGLSDRAMERHYASVIARMGSAVPPAGHIGNSPETLFSSSSRLSSDERAGALPMGILFADGQDSPKMVSQDGIERFETQPGADGVLGSPGGGKTTLDFAYLQRAIKQHGLEVLDLTEAQQISPVSNESSGRYRVSARDLRSGQVRNHYADHVFVAAGTVNTLELLLRSRAASGGLKGMARLGQRFFANGDLTYVCSLPRGRSARPSVPVDGMIKSKEAVRPLGNRPWPFLIFGALPTVGLPLPRFVKRRMMMGIFIAGMGKDESGTAYLKKNRLIIDYDPRRSSIYNDIKEGSAMVAGELGGRLHGGGRPTTAHPMGGACMGRCEADAVVDLNGEVFGHPGIYVCDAAALPYPVGGPPSMTIGAWAEHVAETFIARHGTQASSLDVY